MKLSAGQLAPNFALPDQNGKMHTLSDYKGKRVLLYFYPKDDTPGCVKEACSVRDNFAAFGKMKTVVLGVSVDSVKSHKKFAEKFQLPFPLLADEEKKVVKAYGVWQSKQFMGREYTGTVRSSFLIDPAGRIVKIYERVKADGHAREVLGDLSAALDRKNKTW